MTASATSWLGEPWAGALFSIVADPLAWCDWSEEPGSLPGWPSDVSVTSVLREPALRGRLGRWLLPEAATASILEACQARPRTRLALLPVGEAGWLIARAAAWFDGPHIASLLRRSEVEEARALLGGEALDFALGGAALMARPSATLQEALRELEPAPSGALLRGAALFGLALGPAPVPLLERMLLRRPLAVWAEVSRYARQDTSEAVRDAAFVALSRLARERAASWFVWLS
ncbi:protein of unknown function [Hyphomicrobium sp. MC1]|nr:protein of unknown function [Hyphomicrobium sp. MC1]